jgi:hypothetical protein
MSPSSVPLSCLLFCCTFPPFLFAESGGAYKFSDALSAL